MLGEVRPYSPPRPGAPVDLHLDGNEGQPPAPGLLDELASAGPELLRRYPDNAPLERALAASVRVERERVLVTAGADDALERIERATLAPGRQMLATTPTFGMIARYAALAGGAAVEVPWLSGALPVDQMIAEVNERTSLIVVVSPNSPTGAAARPVDLERLSAAAPGAVLLVDLAYSEFADEDLTAAALALPNAVITRTFSKAWGLAGLRVGWAAGPPEVIDWMRAAGHPYAVSAPSLLMALSRLESGRQEMERFVELVRTQRAELGRRLTDLGASALPSQGNFLLATFDDAVWVRDALAGLGIAVRIFPGKVHLEGRLRVTVPGDEESFTRLCSALRTVLAPEKVILGAASPEAFAAPLEARGLEVIRAGPCDLPRELEIHGDAHIWVVSADAEEIGVARDAGALPLGLREPGDRAAEGELTRAGAGRCVGEVEEILERVP